MKGLFLAVCFFSFSGVFAQGYKIKVELPKAADKNILLAHYLNTQIYINDSIRLDDRGRGVFKGDTLLPQGLYKIYFNNDSHFDFLLSADQDFSVTNKEFTNDGVEISGSTESEEFARYTQFLAGQQAKKRALEEKIKTASPEEQEALRNDINFLTEELYAYWKAKAAEYPGTWLAGFLMANYIPEPEEDKIPAEILANDSMLLRYRYDFQKQHYFDYFDVSDERFLYTPLLKPKIETYFNKVLYPVADSVRVGVLGLIEKSRPAKQVFRYLVSYFLNESNNSKMMGIDALFMDIARKYYLTGEAFWADSATIAKIKENVLFTQNNLIGMVASELKLEGINGVEYYSLRQVDAKITILLIYEPNCSHCKEFVPALHDEVYLPFKNKGLAVYAIYSMDNKKEWEDFVDEKGLDDWINVWDQHHLSGFKVTYDARKTPGIYVLDKDKKIIAKKVSVEQLKQIVEFELGQP